MEPRVYFLYLSHLLYRICVNMIIMNRYISKSYTGSKNTIYRAGAAVVSTITSVYHTVVQGILVEGSGRKRGNHPKSLERNVSIKWVQITFSLSLSVRLVSSSSSIIIISLQKHPPLLALHCCGRFARFTRFLHAKRPQ